MPSLKRKYEEKEKYLFHILGSNIEYTRVTDEITREKRSLFFLKEKTDSLEDEVSILKDLIACNETPGLVSWHGPRLQELEACHESLSVELGNMGAKIIELNEKKQQCSTEFSEKVERYNQYMLMTASLGESCEIAVDQSWGSTDYSLYAMWQTTARVRSGEESPKVDLVDVSLSEPSELSGVSLSEPSELSGVSLSEPSERLGGGLSIHGVFKGALNSDSIVQTPQADGFSFESELYADELNSGALNKTAFDEAALDNAGKCYANSGKSSPTCASGLLLRS